MTKKKLILRLLVGIFGLLVVGAVIVAMSLDLIVKSGVESVGPKMTLTTFTLEKVAIDPFSGSGSIDGLLVGNPAGYTADFAIKMERALLHVRPGSLWSDKVVVETIQVDAPEITFEGGNRDNNLRTILNNIEDYVGEGKRERSERKLQVNHFKLTGAKVHLRLAIFGNQNITLVAPEIELRDLGSGPEGVTSAELTQMVITRITREVSGMMTSALAELGRARADAGSEVSSGPLPD